MTTPVAERTALGALLPERDVVVSDYQLIAEGVVLLTLTASDGQPLPHWDAGAHIDLILTDTITRQYSLCGDPNDRDRWHVAILHEPESRGGSDYVHDVVRSGSQLRVRGPRNNFPLEPGNHYLFIAGGIGVTPLLPMAAAARAAGADWRLLYGGRTRASMAFLDDLRVANFSGDGGRVQIRPQDETGLLDLASYIGSLESGTQVYCCGPEPLLRAVEEQCERHHIKDLHVERFHPAESGPGETFEVELRQDGRTLTVGPDQTILEVLEEAGLDVLSSCGEGTCGTCLVPVLDGVPDHRDSVLTPAERASGREILPCISRSLSPVLVLDI